MRVYLYRFLSFGKKTVHRLKKNPYPLIDFICLPGKIRCFQPIIRKRRIGPSDIIYNGMQLIIQLTIFLSRFRPVPERHIKSTYFLITDTSQSSFQ